MGEEGAIPDLQIPDPVAACAVAAPPHVWLDHLSPTVHGDFVPDAGSDTFLLWQWGPEDPSFGLRPLDQGCLKEFLKLSRTSDELYETSVLDFARRWGALGICCHGLPATHGPCLPLHAKVERVGLDQVAQDRAERKGREYAAAFERFEEEQLRLGNTWGFEIELDERMQPTNFDEFVEAWGQRHKEVDRILQDPWDETLPLSDPRLDSLLEFGRVYAEPLTLWRYWSNRFSAIRKLALIAIGEHAVEDTFTKELRLSEDRAIGGTKLSPEEKRRVRLWWDARFLPDRIDSTQMGSPAYWRSIQPKRWDRSDPRLRPPFDAANELLAVLNGLLEISAASVEMGYASTGGPIKFAPVWRLPGLPATGWSMHNRAPGTSLFGALTLMLAAEIASMNGRIVQCRYCSEYFEAPRKQKNPKRACLNCLPQYNADKVRRSRSQHEG